MFVLVEALSYIDLLDRPSLGSAMLLGALKQKGIESRLLNSQVRLMEFLFKDKSCEILKIFQNMDSVSVDDIAVNNIKKFKKRLDSEGVELYHRYISQLYEDNVENIGARTFLSVEGLTEVAALYRLFIYLYWYSAQVLNIKKFKLIDNLYEEIMSHHPDYVGFSIELLGQDPKLDPLTCLLIEKIRENQKIHVIMGGSGFSFMEPEDIRKVIDPALYDYIVIGAGEDALIEILKSIDSGASSETIKGIIFKRDNEIVHTPARPMPHINDLAFPDYSNFMLDRYAVPEIVLPLQASRGCTWRRCAFCSHHTIYKGTCSFLESDRIIELIKNLKEKYGCRYFIFNDEELPASHARAISSAIIGSGLEDISIYTYARPDKEYDDIELLKLMKKAGFRVIHWGIESGSQKILDIMQKGTDISVIKSILKKCFDSGLANMCFILFGFPGEDKNSADETVQFLIDNSEYISAVRLSRFYISNYSPITKNPGKWGIEISAGGGYISKTGMQPDEVMKYFKNIKMQMKLNKLKLFSFIYRLSYESNLSRLFTFLLYSHDPVTDEKALNLINRDLPENIYPLILGSIERTVGGYSLKMIRTDRSLIENRVLPKCSIDIDDSEKMIWELSDAQRTVKDIEKEMGNGAPVKEFLKKMLKKHNAVCFNKGWSKNLKHDSA